MHHEDVLTGGKQYPGADNTGSYTSPPALPNRERTRLFSIRHGKEEAGETNGRRVETLLTRLVPMSRANTLTRVCIEFCSFFPAPRSLVSGTSRAKRRPLRGDKKYGAQ